MGNDIDMGNDKTTKLFIHPQQYLHQIVVQYNHIMQIMLWMDKKKL